MDIRRAKPADASELTEIAFAAKRHWGYPEAWIELWRTALTITPNYVRTHAVWAAMSMGRAIGFYALGIPGEAVELEHLWVRPEWMGQGVGRALFEHAATQALTMGALRLTIESDPNAEGFYRRMGAMPVGERVSEYAGLRRVLPLLEIELGSLNPPKAAQSQIGRRRPGPDRSV